LPPSIPLRRRNRRPRLADRLRALIAWDGPHRGRRVLALAAAIAVPAMAAPGDWSGFKTISAAQNRAMPFETPGESFPGSAFFYLEDVPQAVGGELRLSDDLPPPLETGAQSDAVTSAGPAARSFFELGSGLDKARALQCMTLALYYEAANEPTDGQRAVAQVILNRVAHPSYPNSVCGVVFQGSERRTGCQFSFTCDGALNRQPARATWQRARSVAAAALSGYVFKPVGLATHYHATYVLPYWASSLQNVGTIGLHTFYKWRGLAGQADAFGARYRGGEPMAAPHPRSEVLTPDSAPDPIVLAQAYEAARRKAAAQSAVYTPPPPTYSSAVQARGGDRTFTAENLPQTNGIKAEFANSGRWIGQPSQAPTR
jgi:spore germination cell wall hydrolase CwlJ-like protein